MVYALGRRGAELLTLETGQQFSNNLTEKNRELQVRYLEHALMISRFHATLQYACNAVGTVLLERWLGDGAIRDAVHVDGERIPIAPDAMFILNAIDGSNPGRVHCLLEADRGTMAVARFVRKLHGYFAFWRSGLAMQRLSIKNFLVVTVTRSQERAENLREAAREVSEDGLRMFVFASEGQVQPADSMRVLRSIWRSPADATLHALTE
jgi:hypothetical protein